MKQLVYSFIFLIAAIPGTVKAESYTCLATQIAGFIYNSQSKQWNSGASANESVYLVRQLGEGDTKHIGSRWFVNEPGKTHGMACKTGFNPDGQLECAGLGGRFIMNRQSLRFEYIYEEGYVEHRYSKASPEGKQAPHMKIGACTID